VGDGGEYKLSGDVGEVGLSSSDVAGSTENQKLKIFCGVLLMMRWMWSVTSEKRSMVSCRLENVEAMQRKQPP
jgi:hypothetical protein